MEEVKITSKEEVTNGNVIKIISSLLPIITVVILVLGLIKQYLFYINFNVPISNFIGLSELGLIISGDLLLVSTFMIILFVLTLFASANKKFVTFFSKDKKSENNRKFLHFLLLIIGFCYVILLTILWKYPFFLAIIAVLASMLLISFELLLREFRNKLFPKPINKVILTLTLILVSVIFIQTAFNIISIEDGKYKGTKIYMSDSTYTSTDSSYFIGKTENYIFIYNKKEKTTSILPTKLLTKIVMKSK